MNAKQHAEKLCLAATNMEQDARTLRATFERLARDARAAVDELERATRKRVHLSIPVDGFDAHVYDAERMIVELAALRDRIDREEQEWRAAELAQLLAPRVARHAVQENNRPPGRPPRSDAHAALRGDTRRRPPGWKPCPKGKRGGPAPQTPQATNASTPTLSPPPRPVLPIGSYDPKPPHRWCHWPGAPTC